MKLALTWMACRMGRTVTLIVMMCVGAAVDVAAQSQADERAMRQAIDTMAAAFNRQDNAAAPSDQSTPHLRRLVSASRSVSRWRHAIVRCRSVGSYPRAKFAPLTMSSAPFAVVTTVGLRIAPPRLLRRTSGYQGADDHTRFISRKVWSCARRVKRLTFSCARPGAAGPEAKRFRREQTRSRRQGG